MTGYQSKRAAAQDKLDSMEREALKLALKVLEDLPGFRADIDNAITAIKEALAQPAQEPVAWMWRCKPYYDYPNWEVSLTRPADSGRDGNKKTDGYEDVPLYTTPPQRPWVGLTDDDKAELAKAQHSWEDLCLAVEAKLKEKNT